MNKSAFLKLIQQVSNISDQQTEELEKVASTFPYCQTAHLLLAKSAYDKGSMLSTQRLRRASSYATDRQLLKRFIYTALPPEPVYEEAATPAVVEEETMAQIMPEAEEADLTADALTEDLIQEEETLEEVYAVGNPTERYLVTESYESSSVEDEAEEKLDSELALLFTFNSISSSSTDLLSDRVQPEDALEEPGKPALSNFQKVDEALAETDVAAEEIPVAEQEKEHASFVEENLAMAVEEPAEEAIPEEEAEEPEEAEINYSVDEIDRLYAEDALGYWMGSSRMGEVLQLKDDYTRQRPQSFHPELILEYSKTHELEKAIQPGKHVLSQQLDIIDQFLKLNPRLKTMANMKLKPEPQEDLSLKSSKIKKGMASENLANIFLNQGKTKKAVKIYEQLILKYPEKKSYFAEQIEKLQNLT